MSSARQTIRVCAPTAHAGIGDALRRAYAVPQSTPAERELLRLLENA